MGEWTERYGNQATKKKLFLGLVTNNFSKIGVVELKIQTNELLLGDQINIIGPTTGVYEGEVDEIRLNRNPVNSAAKGTLVSFKTKELVRRGDKVYKIVENEGQV